MKRFSKNLVAAVLGMGIVLAAAAEMQAGSRFGSSRSSSSRSSGRSFGSSRSVGSRIGGSRFGSSSRSSSSRRIGNSSVKRITPTRTPSRTLPTRNVVKRPTKIGSSLIRRPSGIKLSDIKRPSSSLKSGVNKSFFGGHHNNHNGHNGHHNTHRRNFWWNFGRHVYYRPYIRSYCWGYVPNNCAPTYYNFCEPTYGTVVIPAQAAAPNVIVDNPNGPVVQPNETPTVVRPLDAETMVGIWTAKPAEGVVITATLKQDGTFTWDMASGDQKQSIAGTFEMKGNQLILNREDGQKLEGTITLTGEKSFNFKAKGGDEKDPGLNFAG